MNCLNANVSQIKTVPVFIILSKSVSIQRRAEANILWNPASPIMCDVGCHLKFSFSFDMNNDLF